MVDVQAEPIAKIPGFEPHGQSTELIVLLSGWGCGPESLVSVQEAVQNSRGNADIFLPLTQTGIFSFADPNCIVDRVLSDIDRIAEDENKRYETITLIGHSLGALLARKLYVCAWGENTDAPFEDAIQKKERRVWAKKVKRIVLLAGMNRGWSISHHLSTWRAITWTLGSWLGDALRVVVGRDPLIFTIRRGATFITQLRIQWLSMKRRLKSDGIDSALTIQLLGTVDDMVAPTDNVDLVTGRDFLYLEVPRTGHYDVVDMAPSLEIAATETSNADRASAAKDVLMDIRRDRTRVFLQALNLPTKQLYQLGVTTAFHLPSDGACTGFSML